MTEIEKFINSKISKADFLIDNVLGIISKTPSLSSELPIVVEMASNVNGLKQCQLSQLLSTESHISQSLQEIESYCTYIIENFSGDTAAKTM